MSEKIYAWLWRVYPTHFRNTYADAAVQLFRDRSRDERGFIARLRLSLDLLADLAISVPREYRRAQPRLRVASAPRSFDGIPAFRVFERETPRFAALFYGGVLSLVVFGSISSAIGRSANHGPLRLLLGVFAISQSQAQQTTIPDTPAGKALRAWLDAFNSGDPAKIEQFEKTFDPTKTAIVQSDFRTRTGGFDLLSVTNKEPWLATFRVKEKNSSTEGVGTITVNRAQPATISSFSIRALPRGAVVENVTLDAAERQRVIDGAISNLREYYVYPDVAKKMADALTAHERAGDDNAETDGAAFAELLTKQLQDVSHDRHLHVIYNPFKTPEHRAAAPEDDAEFRKELERDNCAFKEVEILPHNIGYLKFNAFPPPSLCRATAVDAMGFLAHVDAIIFDLRDNHGGDPHMVAFLATYLFDHPTHLNDIYNRRENSTQQYWTLADVPGTRLADKPAYVLTSAETFSGAEEFTYDLKNLKRATIVGETTGGGAHLVDGRRIDDHFMIGVPFARAINPISKTDWEGKGVEPDVKVKAADALETAEKLAGSKLQNQ